MVQTWDGTHLFIDGQILFVVAIGRKVFRMEASMSKGSLECQTLSYNY